MQFSEEKMYFFFMLPAYCYIVIINEVIKQILEGYKEFSNQTSGYKVLKVLLIFKAAGNIAIQNNAPHFNQNDPKNVCESELLP